MTKQHLDKQSAAEAQKQKLDQPATAREGLYPKLSYDGTAGIT